MKFASSRSRRENVEISMIPLIDLFLNILVFFLVTTSFSQESAFFIQLPQASAAKGQGVSKDTKQVFISLDTKGEVSVNNQKIGLRDLKATLEKITAENRRAVPVVVRADKSVMHGQVVQVLDSVRSAGFENVGMATQSISTP